MSQKPLLAVVVFSLFLGGTREQASAGAQSPRCLGKPATVVGTSGDDRFSDNAYAPDSEQRIEDGDVVVTLGGRDVVNVNHYTRSLTICLGSGDDRQVVNAGIHGPITVDGGAGADKIVDYSDFGDWSRGKRRIYGGSGADLLGGIELSPDILVGGPGDDRAFGWGGRDTISMGPGDDRAEGGGSADSLKGGAGDDRLVGGYFGPAPQGYPDTGTDDVNGGKGTDHCEAERKRNCES